MLTYCTPVKSLKVVCTINDDDDDDDDVCVRPVQPNSEDK